MSLCWISQNAAMNNTPLTVMADVVLGYRNLRAGRYYIGAVKIAERT